MLEVMLARLTVAMRMQVREGTELMQLATRLGQHYMVSMLLSVPWIADDVENDKVRRLG
ncbi:Hypothetical protein POVR2_LOCUS261 [uncultured virus]|nr:Hypothetical protein POVR2_LOCUS261 [uncultured virus]